MVPRLFSARGMCLLTTGNSCSRGWGPWEAIRMGWGGGEWRTSKKMGVPWVEMCGVGFGSLTGSEPQPLGWWGWRSWRKIPRRDPKDKFRKNSVSYGRENDGASTTSEENSHFLVFTTKNRTWVFAGVMSGPFSRMRAGSPIERCK